MAHIADNPSLLNPFSIHVLRDLWRRLLPRQNLPRTKALIKHQLAWHAQAGSKAAFDIQTQALIRNAERQARITKAESESRDITPPRAQTPVTDGVRLVREWGGETHEVIYRDRQYHYRDAAYRSLTQVAGVITGTHWSGPRFFGLNSSARA